LACRPTGRLYRRAYTGFPGPGLADRAVRRAAPASPHAPASTADDGRASAALAGGAPVSHAAWPPPTNAHLLGRAIASVARFAAVLRAADSPGRGAAPICRCHVALACAGRL